MTKRQQAQFDALLQRVEDIYAGVGEGSWEYDSEQFLSAEKVPSVWGAVRGQFDLGKEWCEANGFGATVGLTYAGEFDNPRKLTEFLFSNGVCA